MGVIIKLLYRSEGLKKPTHRNLFMDMEENIHIHLRDLRIELSRKEFEDIVRTFGLQSKELMEIINETDYQDGVLPNANTDSATIWTESKLVNDVVYHPQRISLEECTDGFHLHIRNYKILLDNDDFSALAKAFKTIDLDAPYASTPEEIITLLDVNHIHYLIKNENTANRKNKANAIRRIVVANYHKTKVTGILSEIGMERSIEGGIDCYTNEDSTFYMEVSDNKALFSHNTVMGETSLLPLPRYLSFAQSINPDELNAIKARVLDTFTFVNKSNSAPNINLDYRSWIYNSTTREIIFPFCLVQSKPDTKKLYREWSDFLTGLDMYFVKPTKITVSDDRQKILYDEVLEKINLEVAPIACVSKVHIMGSATRGEMGLYKSPFIHSSWAKLGSDYDLLIEIDESQPIKFPEHWNYINVSKTNQCDIYHIGEIDADDDFEHRKRYPSIDFFQHLLDAYVYIPSKGDADKKDAFLKKFKAKVIFDCEAGGKNRVQAVLEHEFGDNVQDLVRLDVATENELYGVKSGKLDAVLKVYKVSGNYSSKRMAEHAEYECEIISAAEDRGVPTASVIHTIDGKSVFEIDGHAAVMFRKLNGIEGGEPDFPVVETAKALARFHEAQINNPINIKSAFSFDQVFDLWRVEFHRFADESKHDEKLSESFSKLDKIYNDLEKTYTNLTKKKKIVWLHNHGDVTPRNVFLNDGVTYLFDFQNAFYGPRLFDIVEGGIEFSWGAKDAKYNDFKRFNQFVSCYRKEAKLSVAEERSLEAATKILGIIKFIKEVRMIKGAKDDNNLRRLRALDLAGFLLSHRFPRKRC